MHKHINIPADILPALRRLSERGIAALPVGGCVRDCLRGEMPHDWDIAAGATPEELISALEGFNISTEGIRYGTVTVHTEKRSAEITCFRRESGYSDRRRPDSVEYTNDLNEDLARRDFTINAMAYHIESDTVIDPFGGIGDLRDGIIRCVGEPSKRFGEDALRILRALRFSSVLGYKIEENTEKSVHEMRELIDELSGERVLAELKKLLCGKGVFDVLMNYCDVICTVIPELKMSVGFDQHNPHHIYSVYEHIARTVAALPDDPLLRLTMLFHDMAKPYVCTVDDKGIFHFRGHPEAGAKMADEVLCRLKADTKTREEVKFLITYHDVRPVADRAGIHRYMSKTGYEGAKTLLYIRRADLSAQSPEFHSGFEYIDRCEDLIEELHAEGAALKVSDLAVDGSDISALGVSRGRRIGELLQYLLEQVVQEKAANEKDELLKLCREKLAE